MSSALEIVTLTGIEGTTTNDSAFSEIMKVAAAEVGLRAQFWGNGVEAGKSNVKLWVLDWTEQPGMAPTSEAWKSVDKGIKELTQTALRRITINLRRPNINNDNCLTAPVTEVVFVSMKPETEVDVFTGIIDDTLRLTAEQPGCTGTAWGYIAGNDREAVMFIGWGRIEDHTRYTDTDGFKTAIPPFLAAISNADMFHVEFRSQ